MSGVSHWFCASPVPQHWEIDWSRLAFQCTLIPLTAHLAAKRSCLEGLLLILWFKLCGHGVVILCFCERTCVRLVQTVALLLLSVKVRREGYNNTVPVDANVFQDACENVGIDCVSHCRVERMLQDYMSLATLVYCLNWSTTFLQNFFVLFLILYSPCVRFCMLMRWWPHHKSTVSSLEDTKTQKTGWNPVSFYLMYCSFGWSTCPLCHLTLRQHQQVIQFDIYHSSGPHCNIMSTGSPGHAN